MKKNTTIKKITDFLFHNGKKGWTVAVILGLFLMMILSGLFSEPTSPESESEPRTEQSSTSETADSESVTEDSEQSESVTEESEETAPSQEEKLTPAAVHSFASARKYINDQLDSEIIKEVSKEHGRLTLETEGIMFTKSFLGGSSDGSQVAKAIGAAHELSQSSQGLIVKQYDPYTKGDGNEETALSYMLYYSPKVLNRINFENWHTECFNQPKFLAEQATEFCFQGVFLKQKKGMMKGLGQDAKIAGNGIVVFDYMDQLSGV